MSEKTYLWVLQIGVFASFFTFLFSFKGLFFPFITSKQIVFNILIEVLFFIWLAFILRFRDYKPKKSLLTMGILLYFIAIFISAMVGVDFNLSFWGNAERMLGLYHLIHFLLLFLMIISVMRTFNNWRLLFGWSLLIGAIIAIKGFFVGPASSIGNTAYVAGLMIFDCFFALYLIVKGEELWEKILAGIGGILVLIGFLNAQISGAQAGFLAGALVFAVMFGFLTKKKALKITLLSGTAALIIAVLLLVTFRWNPVFDGTKIGSSLRDFSTKNITWNTRVLSWTAAVKDFGSHPVFGVGYGNYASVFDKYFNVKFFDYSKTETYFDRAHNNIIDITSTTGIVGLVTYLSIFAAALYYLILAYRKKRADSFEFSWALALLAAYFVQNLAVFDSLITYVSLFVFLGFIHYLYFCRVGENDVSEIETLKIGKKLWARVEHNSGPLLIIAGLILLYSIWNFNINGFKALNSTIKSYMAIYQGDLYTAYQYSKQGADYGVPYNRDSRSNFITFLSQNAQALSKLKANQATEVLDYALRIADANIGYNPHDSMLRLQHARIYNVAARFNFQNQEKFNQYSAQALTSIDEAILASKERIPLYFVKADIHLTRAEGDKAMATLAEAQKLKPDYYDTNCMMANFAYVLQATSTAATNGMICAEHDLAATYLSDPGLLQTLLDGAKKNNNQVAIKSLEAAMSKKK